MQQSRSESESDDCSSAGHSTAQVGRFQSAQTFGPGHGTRGNCAETACSRPGSRDSFVFPSAARFRREGHFYCIDVADKR